MLVLLLLAGWWIGGRMSAASDAETRKLAGAAAPWMADGARMKWELVRNWEVPDNDRLERVRTYARRIGAGDWEEESSAGGKLLRTSARWKFRSGDVDVTLLAGGDPARVTVLVRGGADNPAEAAAGVSRAKTKLAEALRGLGLDDGAAGSRLAVQGTLRPDAEPGKALDSAAAALSAKELNRYRDAATISAAYRTDKLTEYGSPPGAFDSGNLQAAVHRNSETGEMIFVLGTPVLGGDFVIH
ncbi:hypothetical protein ACFQWB_08680 [Paenibacillus thermoaerophilus]|uniref:TATA-box binding n=1 Tax=Paenibacillus thermoaerophilus TaxID=1215385 RepID=A0ABW2V605_9BACL|nr:hypothetical protein [Paenibacillus thermoaerophilus]TMV18535.1 hypothetical protein FE781_03770 [Paenibacillus thermoaerophilus]